jgi:hypothetical protein
MAVAGVFIVKTAINKIAIYIILNSNPTYVEAQFGSA